MEYRSREFSKAILSFPPKKTKQKGDRLCMIFFSTHNTSVPQFPVSKSTFPFSVIPSYLKKYLKH